MSAEMEVSCPPARKSHCPLTQWFAVYCVIVAKPKYRRLSPSGKGALLQMWALAAMQTPEAAWRSRGELLDALELDGFTDEDLESLIRLGWLDIEPDGTALVHDWDQWQIAASDAARRLWEASRKRSWRRQRRASSAPPPAPSSPQLLITGEDKTGVPIRPVHVPDVSGTEGREGAYTPPPDADRDCLDTYHELTGYRPWGVWSGDKLREAIRDFGDPAVDAALRAEHQADTARDSLLDRSLSRLARQAERAALNRPKREHRSTARTPEQEARRQEVLRSLMLMPKIPAEA